MTLLGLAVVVAPTGILCVALACENARLRRQHAQLVARLQVVAAQLAGVCSRSGVDLRFADRGPHTGGSADIARWGHGAHRP